MYCDCSETRTWHTNGLSPVCFRRCLARAAGVGLTAPQYSQVRSRSLGWSVVIGWWLVVLGVSADGSCSGSSVAVSSCSLSSASVSLKVLSLLLVSFVAFTLWSSRSVTVSSPSLALRSWACFRVTLTNLTTGSADLESGLPLLGSLCSSFKFGAVLGESSSSEPSENIQHYPKLRFSCSRSPCETNQ